MQNTERIWTLVEDKRAPFQALADRIWGMRQGATDYLLKPIDAAALVARIKAMG